MGICSVISTEWLFIRCLEKLVFVEGGIGEPGEKTSEQGGEPKTSSTHLRRQLRLH